MATGLWNEINYVNLKENILPTRERASLILTKSEKHAVDQEFACGNNCADIKKPA